MDIATMLTSATCLLAIAAVGGLLMAVTRLSGVPRPPLLLAMGHGLLAAAGLTLVVYATLAGDVSQRVQLAGLLLVGAALGGALLHVLYHAKGLALPVAFIIGHGLVAAFALGLLWMGAGRPLPF